MILLIDWGNTYLKYLIIEDTTVIETELNINKVQQTSSLENLFDVVSKYNIHSKQKISRTVISSVRKASDNESLAQSLNKLKVQSTFAKTAREFSGVVCAYSHVESLGIDRWLTIIAGFNSEKTTGIIDVGSAITLDVVSKDGQHLGGQIVPGNRLLLESLKATDRILLSNEAGLSKKTNNDNILLGRSTDECVGFGIDRVIQSYLQCSITDVTKKYQVEHWILTGGGGKYWTNELENFYDNIVYDGLLVFKGLIEFKNQLRGN